MTQALHIPLDFERRETVRLLAHRLLLIGVEFSEMAPLYALRVWLDWGAVGKQLRPLQKTIVGKPREHPREHYFRAGGRRQVEGRAGRVDRGDAGRGIPRSARARERPRVAPPGRILDVQ